jgi:hypothetical protein
MKALTLKEREVLCSHRGATWDLPFTHKVANKWNIPKYKNKLTQAQIDILNQNKIINEGGINGLGKGQVDITDKDFLFLKEQICLESNKQIAMSECSCKSPTLQKDTKQCGHCKLYIGRIKYILLTNKSEK